MRRAVALSVLMVTVGAARADDLPTNPNVTQATIGSTICVTGWARTVRPPQSYTNAVKLRLMREIGAVYSHDWILDHKSAWRQWQADSPRAAAPLRLSGR